MHHRRTEPAPSGGRPAPAGVRRPPGQHDSGGESVRLRGGRERDVPAPAPPAPSATSAALLAGRAARVERVHRVQLRRGARPGAGAPQSAQRRGDHAHRHLVREPHEARRRLVLVIARFARGLQQQSAPLLVAHAVANRFPSIADGRVRPVIGSDGCANLRICIKGSPFGLASAD